MGHNRPTSTEHPYIIDFKQESASFLIDQLILHNPRPPEANLLNPGIQDLPLLQDYQGQESSS